ncbi:putative leader peptide [Streptomyces sp. NPDC006658]
MLLTQLFTARIYVDLLRVASAGCCVQR